MEKGLAVQALSTNDTIVTCLAQLLMSGFSHMKYNLISLFAGAGGLDLGLEMAGFTTKIANELEPYACETLRRNKAISTLNKTTDFENFVQEVLKQKCYRNLSERDKHHLICRLKMKFEDGFDFLTEANIIEGDIRSISSSQFREALGTENLFCIAGGPPCQPFSKAGKQKSVDCTKNGDLFFEFIKKIQDLQPKWFIFENVKGLTFTKTDVLYLFCRSCNKEDLAPFEIRKNFNPEVIPATSCTNCGCRKTEWKIRNEQGGSLKIILNEFKKTGYSCETKILNSADYGAPQIRERLFIVGNIEGKKIKWPTQTHSRTDNNNKELKQGDFFSDSVYDKKPWVSMYDALWVNGHSEYGLLDKEVAELWVKNVVRPHDEPVTWSLDRPSPTIGAHQAAKLAIAPFGVPDSQIFRQQWHTKGRRQGDTKPVFVEHQLLSDEELLKLQTFPSWWYLHGTRMQRAFQIGNAVPPLLGKLIGKAIIESDKGDQKC